MCKIVCYCSLANRFEALNNASRRARSRSAIGLEMIISARSHEDLSLTCSAQVKKRSCTHYAGLRAGYEKFNICFERTHDLMGALTL